MEKYTLFILLFFIYSFSGWLVEVLINLVRYKRFINRGFLIGPLCPIYGVGGVFMYLTLSKYTESPIALFILSMVTCSILEYFTSWIMEVIFKNRWWDYSKLKYNINGRICLEYAFFFGLGAIFIFYFANPILVPFIESINSDVLVIASYILISVFIIDWIISFDIIFNLKSISNQVRSDSSEVISLKVKEILLTKNFLYRRLVKAFPAMYIKNNFSRLREKLEKRKAKIKSEKKKLREERKELFLRKWKRK